MSVVPEVVPMALPLNTTLRPVMFWPSSSVAVAEMLNE